MSDLPPPTKPGLSIKRLLPLLVLALGLVLFLALDLDRYLSFDTLREHRESLTHWVADNTVLAVLAYMGIYTLVVAFSLPGGAVMTLTGGFLFGALMGALWAVFAATLGATLLFLAARTALGDLLRAKAGTLLGKMEAGFNDNALSYLLVLRLVPLFPFWAVNLAPALLGVPLGAYVLGTFFGIIPGTFVYASVGNGLGAIFDRGETPDLGLIFNPQILLPLIGLAVLALIPVLYKKLRARKTSTQNP